MPSISIVMPTYNQVEFLWETLQSILEDQMYKDFELIIVDDASTDGTAKLLRRIRDNRVRIVHLGENGGTGYALNKGFEYATGQYETWWASDNIMAPHMLMALHERMLLLDNPDFVYSDCSILNEDTGKRSFLSKEVGGQEFDPQRLLWQDYLGICWLWRRELRIAAGQHFQLEPCEDYDMILRMVDAGGKFVYMHDVLGVFHRHSANMSAKINREKPADYYSILVREKAAMRRTS